MTLVLIGLLGGLITGVSPCILPVLPVVFLGGATPGADAITVRSRRRPFLVVAGLCISFALFTLLGSLVLSLLHLPSDLIRWLGLAALVVLGLALIVPAFERLLEKPFSRLPQRHVKPDGNGFLLGLALGAVFVPCAGPVLAAITVAGTTGDIGADTVALTVSFAIGCAVPLLVFALAGRQVVARVRAFQKRQRVVRIVSGAVMISLAIALATGVTDAVQRIIPNYTEALGNSLEGGVSSAESGGSGSSSPVSLSACQTAALYGGLGLADCGPAPAFAGISTWLDTTDGDPLRLSELKGKVVLVDFWAYSCINCQRELPHVEAWYQRYTNDGLEVVGVHTPEYAFEHDPANVAAGAQRLGLTFPIAIDDRAATWSAYRNSSWPASYLIDARGRIRSVSIGEGDYAHEESLIRALLRDADPSVRLPGATDLPDTTPHDGEQSPETYLGSQRQQYFQGDGSYENGTRSFSLPSGLSSGYALGGTWTIGDESITAGSGASIRLAFHASKVYLDVGGTGTLTVTQGGSTRELAVSGAPNISTVASSGSAKDGTVTIGLSPGLEAYSFTFG